jgi:pilus assembly protein CpaF
MAAPLESMHRSNERETGWVNRLFTKEGYTPEYQELKFTLHRKLLDRINLEALSSSAPWSRSCRIPPSATFW